MAFLDALLGGLKGVANSSTPLPPEPTVNFTGSGVTVTDDPTNGQTTVNIPGGAASSRIYVLPQTYGAVGNGSTDDSGAFNTMIAANAGKDILVGDGTFHLANNVSFNANQNIYFQNGAVLNIASGKTLAMGKVNANLTQQIFSGSGSVTLPTNTVASPVWWGATGNGSSDDAPAMAAAIASGANIEIPPGTYKLNSNVTFDVTKEVRFHAGAILDRGSSVLVDVASHIDAPLGAQIFTPGFTFTSNVFTAGFLVGRANSENIYACWWGAKADNSNDDYLAIQSALMAANNLVLAYQSLGVRPGDFGAPTVRLLPGRHKILSTLQMNWGTNFIGAEGRTSFITDDSGTIHLLRSAGNGTITKNIVFERGLASVIYGGFSSVFGGNIGNFEANGNFHIENCAFSDPQYPALFIDTSVQLRGDTAFLTVVNCSFYGACFAFINHDQWIIRDCEILYDPQAATLVDTQGFPLACINCSGYGILDNNIAVPITTITRSCWIQAGSGADIQVKAFRFGGESTAVIFRGRGHNVISFGGSTISNDNVPYSIAFYDTGISSTAGINAFEFYDSMPIKFALMNPFASANIGGVNVDDPGTLGIFIDSNTISLATIEALQSSNYYKFFGYRSSMQWRYGSDYSSANGTDITSIIRNELWNDQDLPKAITENPRNNLFLAGITDPLQLTNSATHLTATATSDTFTGYQLTKWQGDSSIAIFGVHTIGSGGTPSGWGGSNATAGEYVYSWYMKCSTSGNIIVSQNGQNKAYLQYVASDTFVRYQYRFYHDGTTSQDINIAMGRIEPNTVFYIGLFAIHPGRDAAPYTFPIDSLSSPTTNTTNNDKIAGVYWATAAPSGGTYKAGDIVFNSSPSAGSPVGWFCKADGSPGTFEAFGATATSSDLGQIELNTDLGGTANAPTVVQLTGSAGVVTIPGTELNLTSTAFINLGSSAKITGATGSFISIGTTPASTGSLRVENNVNALVCARAGGGNISLVRTDSSNNVYMGDTTNTGAFFVQNNSSTILQAFNSVQFVVGNGSSSRFSCTGCTTFDFDSSITIQNVGASSDVAPNTMTVKGGNALNGASTNKTGGALILEGGLGASGGFAGPTQISLAGNSYIEAAHVSTGNHVVALAIAGNVGTSQMPSNTGDAVVFLANAATAPTANSVGGGIIYCEGGAMKFRGTSGTVTTLGAA